MIGRLITEEDFLLKLKFTTKVYIFANALLILLRTLQIMFLTEPQTAFLKNGHAFFNWTGSIISVLVLSYMALNSYLALRQPTEIGSVGVTGFIFYALSSVFFAVGGASAFVNRPAFWVLITVTALSSAVICLLFAIGEISDYIFPRPASLIFIACILCEMLAAYKFYTEHPLRVRTVFEIFAICASLLFFVTFGKVMCGVKEHKNFRLMYPLGLISSTLCFASVIPETLARIFGFGENVSSSCVSQLLLMGAAVFISAVTLATFRKRNTRRPQRREE